MPFPRLSLLKPIGGAIWMVVEMEPGVVTLIGMPPESALKLAEDLQVMAQGVLMERAPEKPTVH